MVCWMVWKRKKKIKKLNIFCCLCIDELKCPDLIGKQSPTNEASPWKQLTEKWIFNYCYWKWRSFSTWCIRSSIWSVTEKLNELFAQKYDDTEKTKFDVPENPQKPEIIIHQHLDWYSLQI